jgi:hypothetical protein
VKEYLQGQPEGFTISTRELGQLLSPDDPYVAVQCLTAIAKSLALEGFVKRGAAFKNKWGKSMQPNIWGMCAPNTYVANKAETISAVLSEDCLPAKLEKKNSAQIVAEWKAKNAARRQRG